MVFLNLNVEKKVSVILDKHMQADKKYFDLLNLVLNEGVISNNRTGVKTYSVFGAQTRFNLNNGFPLLTTKQVHFKSIVHELLWFLNGDTNIKYLVQNGVNIWTDWAYKKYCDFTSVNEGGWWDDSMRHNWDGTLSMYSKEEFSERIVADKKVDSYDGGKDKFSKIWGDLGYGTYGSMWRNFPCADGENGVNQIQKVINTLKMNPEDRRMIVSAWHPDLVDNVALPPCHVMFHFNTSLLSFKERRDYFNKNYNVSIEFPKDAAPYKMTCYMDEMKVPKRKLNCLMYQRSADLFLGVPFNIASYSLLMHLMAREVNMVPNEFVHTFGDLHIYENHIEQVKEQLSRKPFAAPTLWLNEKIDKVLDFEFKDIRIKDYQYQAAIKADVAV